MPNRRSRLSPTRSDSHVATTAGSPTITPVPTSVAAFVGAFAAGPVDVPVACRSLAEVEKLFGGPSGDVEDDATVHAIRQFFANGGRDAVVVRVERADSVDLSGDEAASTGVHALDGNGTFSTLCIPAAVTSSMDVRETGRVYAAAIEVCEREGAMLLVDTPVGLDGIAALATWLRAVRPVSPDAAAYFPRVAVPDPVQPARHLDLAPSGAVAGIFSRTDRDRGVWKAPAGVEAALWGVDRLVLDLPPDDVAAVTGLGVNPLRHLTGDVAGVWGARTTASADGSEWRYVPVRRTATFIRRSLESGLAWTAGEPNGQKLWETVVASVSDFLDGLFRQGAFQGGSSRDAYFVRCDRSTTTQSDIDDGRFNIIAGFAALHPAEFVIVRTTHRAGS